MNTNKVNATSKMNATGKRAVTPKGLNAQDALAMLKADHDKVRDLFKQYEELMDQDDDEGNTIAEKAAIAQQACNALKIHSQLEEEIFYPAAREAIDDDDLMDEASVEHAGVKELIEQIEAMQPDDDLYDAKVVVLGEQVEHHVREEEREMFPMVKKAKVDIAALGAQMQRRKSVLMSEMGMPEEHEEAVPSANSGKKKSRPSHGRTLS